MKIVNVKDFGARGDGCTLNTEAIQKAIDSLESGDTLLFENGTFLTGTISLKSDMVLKIEKGAEICGSRNIEHYRANGFYHNEMIDTVSLIYALDCDNIEITGGGVIQLSGDAFVDFDTYLPDYLDADSMNKAFIEQTVIAIKKRPTQPIFFNNCKNLRIQNVKIFDSPCWTMVFSNCENILVDSVYVDNHVRIPNNDGVHFTASRNIVVKNSTFLCGDDCFAATCITNRDGVCENMEISDCLMSSRSAAIRFGHLYSKVRNVVVKNIKILPSNRGISIFTGDEGMVENIVIENVEAKTQIHAGYWWGKGEGFVICAKNAKGQIKNIKIKNCSFIEENPSIVVGDNNVSDVTLQNCSFKYEKGYTHPYYYGKMDIQPNIQTLEPAPFKEGDTLYVDGCVNFKAE